MDKKTRRQKQADDFMTMKELLALCMNRWMWFVISLVISMTVAVYYLQSTPEIYTRTISVLVKDGKNGSDTNQQLEDLGIDMTSSNINDEIVSIHSPAVVQEMVRRLRLNMSYYRPGIFKDKPLYAESLPIEVELPDLNDNENASFLMTIKADSTIILSDITRQKEKFPTPVKIKINETSQTVLGKITVKPTLFYQGGVNSEIKVTRSGFNGTVKRFGSAISAQLQEKKSNIIDVKCNDVSIARAENILNTLVSIYNENWVRNRNQISVSTNEFIKERLQVIEQELGTVDNDISTFKSANAMPDVQAVASQAMAQAHETSKMDTEISNQLYMARYIRNYITSNQHPNQLLPANSGINNPYIEQQIAEYNNTQLERNNLLATSSDQNPLVMDLDRTLNTLRHAIVNSLDNELTTLNTQQRSVQASHGQAMAQMAANPSQAKYLLSVERQQKVKESLYLFLLQKREENELSQAFTAYNTRVIAPPSGSDLPTSPVRSNILLIGFVLGLLIPASIVFILESTNTAIRGRKDLDDVKVPLIGEVPLWQHRVRWWNLKKSIETKKVRMVVKAKSSNIVNEAFRIVRTNLDFVLNSSDPDKTSLSKVIMLTSFNPGSGKTFICANLGVSFSIRESKTLCLDLDMRRSSLSAYAGKPEEGLSDYLCGRVNDYRKVIVHQEETGLDILPVGTMPPNPTELLLSPRMNQLMEELRLHYDYIFLDCPPVDIVADASIISSKADLTIFVVRSTLMQKSMLPELEKLYDEKKYNNLTMLLNGTDLNNQYGYNRYGYGYGRSGYGYGYGHGYGYGDKK